MLGWEGEGKGKGMLERSQMGGRECRVRECGL